MVMIAMWLRDNPYGDNVEIAGVKHRRDLPAHLFPPFPPSHVSPSPPSNLISLEQDLQATRRNLKEITNIRRDLAHRLQQAQTVAEAGRRGNEERVRGMEEELAEKKRQLTELQEREVGLMPPSTRALLLHSVDSSSLPLFLPSGLPRPSPGGCPAGDGLPPRHPLARPRSFQKGGLGSPPRLPERCSPCL